MSVFTYKKYITFKHINVRFDQIQEYFEGIYIISVPDKYELFRNNKVHIFFFYKFGLAD